MLSPLYAGISRPLSSVVHPHSYALTHLRTHTPTHPLTLLLAATIHDRYNDDMSQTEGLIRNVLAIAWCLLIGAGYFLAQYGGVTGSSVSLSDPAVILLQWLFAGFLGLFVLLAFRDYRKTSLSAVPSEASLNPPVEQPCSER